MLQHLKKEAMNLNKNRRKGYVRRVGGKKVKGENDVIIIRGGGPKTTKR